MHVSTIVKINTSFNKSSSFLSIESVLLYLFSRKTSFYLNFINDKSSNPDNTLTHVFNI